MVDLRCLLGLITVDATFMGDPENSDLASASPGDMRDFKTAWSERAAKEHVRNTAVGTAATDGWHLEGSGKAYYQSSAPTTRPDGVTALSASDAGRLWADSSSSPPVLYAWSGSVWVEVCDATSYVTLSGSQTIAGDKTFSGSTSFSGGLTVTGTANAEVRFIGTGSYDASGASGSTLGAAYSAVTAAVPSVGNWINATGYFDYGGARRLIYAIERTDATTLRFHSYTAASLTPSYLDVASGSVVTFAGSIRIFF